MAKKRGETTTVFMNEKTSELMYSYFIHTHGAILLAEGFLNDGEL